MSDLEMGDTLFVAIEDGRHERTAGAREMRSIVVGYDGSEKAKRALLHAAEYARDDGQIVVVSVVRIYDRHPTLVGEVREIKPEDHVLELDGLIVEAKETLGKRRVKLVAVEAFGDPAMAIIEAAEKHQADLVVIGSRGHNPFRHVLLGSVTTKVVHHAPCDVFVVR